MASPRLPAARRPNKVQFIGLFLFRGIPLQSNLHEVRARGSELHVLADQDTRLNDADRPCVIRTPHHAGLLSPLLHTVPLQLLAYPVALEKGTDIDKPRNLAKSVTVE